MPLQSYLADSAMAFSKSAVVMYLTVLAEWTCFLIFVNIRSMGRGMYRAAGGKGYAARPGLRFSRRGAALAGGLLVLEILVQYRFWPVTCHCCAMMILWTVFIDLFTGSTWHSAVCESSFFCLLLELGKSFFKDGILAEILFTVHPGIPSRSAGWISLLFYFLYMALMLRTVRSLVPGRPETDPRPAQTAALLFPLLLYLFVRQYRSSLGPQTDPGMFLFLDLTGFAIAACAVIVMVITARMLRAQAARNELLQQQLLSEQQHAQYLISKEALEAVNRRYHDLKHYVNALEAGADSEKLREFAREMREEIQSYETIQKTGNETMDVLLAQRIRECQEKKIRFIPVVDGRKLDLFSTVDLCTLFGNAMDNAVEESLRTEDVSAREINVKVENFGDLVILRFANCCASPLYLAEGSDLPATCKEDPASHGYGLSAIRRIAEKYGGSMHISAQDSVFELVVMVPAVQSEGIG